MIPIKTTDLSPKTIKRTKYGAKKVQIQGITFDSRRESARYLELKLLERAGVVENLQLQVKFPLRVNDQLIANYVADFVYVNEEGKKIVEDSKGYRTPEYKLKKKLMKAIYDICILET